MNRKPLEDELMVLCGCGRQMDALIAHPDEVLYGCATCIPGQVNVSRKSRGLIETERTHSRACRDQDVARAVAVALANRDGEIEELRQTDWQPIATCPREVTRALLLYPAFKLADGELTTEPSGEPLVTMGYRSVGGGWEEIDPTLEATGEFFGDNWEYGEPTHWMPLPPPPAQAPTDDEEKTLSR